MPKGSKFIWEDGEREIGLIEGLALYFDQKTHEVDMSMAQKILTEVYDMMKNNVYYTSNRITEDLVIIYFYGPNYTEMKVVLDKVLNGYTMYTYTIKQIV